MAVQLRFWLSSYVPEEVLTTFDPVVYETAFEVSQDNGVTWRLPTGGATFQDVHSWMLDNELRVVDTKLAKSRRMGRWEGQYVLTIGKDR